MGYERDRGSAAQRGYGQRWVKASATFLARRPWCMGCEALGRKTKAELVDHVEPHKGDQKKFWDTTMWAPLCRHCHDVVKQRLERMYEAGQVAVVDLWLTSAKAMEIGRRNPPRANIGVDGWLT